jgi:antitoxin HigA-1
MKRDAIEIAMRPSHPGELIREEVLAPLGLSTTKAAAILGVRRATLSALINERAALSPEMALRIEKAFGLDMDTLLRMQAWHDATVMRERADELDIKRYEPEIG